MRSTWTSTGSSAKRAPNGPTTPTSTCRSSSPQVRRAPAGVRGVPPIVRLTARRHARRTGHSVPRRRRLGPRADPTHRGPRRPSPGDADRPSSHESAPPLAASLRRHDNAWRTGPVRPGSESRTWPGSDGSGIGTRTRHLTATHRGTTRCRQAAEWAGPVSGPPRPRHARPGDITGGAPWRPPPTIAAGPGPSPWTCERQTGRQGERTGPSSASSAGRVRPPPGSSPRTGRTAAACRCRTTARSTHRPWPWWPRTTAR